MYTDKKAILLVALILFQGIGWFCAWKMVHFQAQFAAQKALNQEDTPLQTAVLHLRDFQKNKVGKKEVRIHDDLFDIRSMRVVGDSVQLVLYHDWHEQALYSILGLQVSQKDNPATAPLPRWMAQWLGSAFIVPDHISLILMPDAVQTPLFCWQFPSTTGDVNPPFAPPELFLI